MYKLVAVLFMLNSVVVCHSLVTKDYQEPAATSYTSKEDAPEDAKQYGFGVSKKYGYNKMVVATYLGPVPVEASESHATYVIHPIDKEYIQKESNDNLAENPIVIEDTAETKNFFKMFPIVVEESEETEEAQQKPKTDYKGYRQMEDEGDGDSYRSWYFVDEPKAKNVLDEEVQDLYLKWFEKQEPKATVGKGFWKSFTNDFDKFYKDEVKQFFGNNDEIGGYTKEGESDKKNDNFGWFSDIPLKYENGDKSDDNSDKNNNKWDYFTHEPKDDFVRNYDFNDNNYGYRWWREW